MKTRTIIPGKGILPVWQSSDKAEYLLEQVRKLTRELHALQSELFHELAQSNGALRKRSDTAGYDTAGDLNQLKAAADEIRRVLWLCLENASEADRPQTSTGGRGDVAEKVYQAGRWLMRQTEPAPVGMEPGSFFERLNLAIEGHMQNRGITSGDKNTKS
jgi:hypothetical protein